MDTLNAVFTWFLQSENWLGDEGIFVRLSEHLYYVRISLAIATGIALPLGIAIAHYKRSAHIAIGLFNLGRALPSLGVVILAIMVIGFDVSAVILALTLMSIPPILTNTIVGIGEVESSLKNSAKAMGMRRRDIILELELPLAFPIIFVGFRTALLQLIATATIAAYAGFGGLGRFLIDGLGRYDIPQTIAGAITVSVLAMLSEGLCSGAEKLIRKQAWLGKSPLNAT
jgi:osmoprotectant transport system permease protein